MPINYKPETKEWVIENASPEELTAILEVGKMMLVQGTAGAFTRERYHQWLMNLPTKNFFNS